MGAEWGWLAPVCGVGVEACYWYTVDDRPIVSVSSGSRVLSFCATYCEDCHLARSVNLSGGVDYCGVGTLVVEGEADSAVASVVVEASIV